jgi:hypothetical protein
MADADRLATEQHGFEKQKNSRLESLSASQAAEPFFPRL